MPKKLLLADDSITIQKVIGITFANEDFALTTVDNGVDAIATAKRLKPDLILADVVMPGKNGYEVCEYVKHHPELRGTPVLLLAGTFESFDEAEMARVGADGYITKPFESQTLIDKVHELTSRAQTGRGGTPAPSPAPAAAADEFNLDDFSPFEEVPEGQGEPEPAEADGTAAAWDAQSGPGDDDVWDLSDFEAVAEGSTADQEEALFAEAEAGAGVEPAPAPGAGGIVGEETFDFGEAAAEDAFEAPAETAAGPGEALELTEFEEVIEGDSFLEDAPDAAGAAAPGEAEGWEPSQAMAEAGEWEVAPVAQVKPVAGRPAAAAAARQRIPAHEMGALAKRVRAAAEGLAGQVKGAGIGLPPEQVEAIVAKVAREVIEDVAWEVVPDLCEALIRAEIRKITGK